MPRPLTERSLRQAVRTLAADDPGLAASVERFGPPPLWAREPSSATLVHLILEQQVSLASALAAFERLRIATGDLTPASFLTLDDRALREIGFSRQKAGYARDLAIALTDGFDLTALELMTDEEVRRSLVSLRGIGRWTADVYLTMCLLRPDVWPHGDLALATGAAELLVLPQAPDVRRARGACRAVASVPRRRRPDHLASLPGRPGSPGPVGPSRHFDAYMPASKNIDRSPRWGTTSS